MYATAESRKKNSVKIHFFFLPFLEYKSRKIFSSTGNGGEVGGLRCTTAAEKGFLFSSSTGNNNSTTPFLPLFLDEKGRKLEEGLIGMDERERVKLCVTKAAAMT